MSGFTLGKISYVVPSFLVFLSHIGRILKDGIIVCNYVDLNGESIDPQELQVAANDLRYHFNLITAEETEEWLGSRELSLNNLNDFLRRKILVSHFADQLDEIRKQIEVGRLPIYKDLWPELLLSDNFPQLITELVWRTLVTDLKLVSSSSADKSEIHTIEEEFCQREGIHAKDLPNYLKLSPFLHDTYDVYLALEVNFRKFSKQLLTAEKANLLLKSLHNHLVRVVYESIYFSDLEHAKEAYLCATEDGLTFPEIASQTGGIYTKSTQFLDEIPETLRRLFLSAAIEEAIPPRTVTQANGGFYIHRVLKKIQPELEAPAVYNRLKQESIKENLAPVAKANVKWLKWDLNLFHG